MLKEEVVYVCFVDQENRSEVSKKLLEWEMWKQRVRRFFVRSVMSLYEEAKGRV